MSTATYAVVPTQGMYGSGDNVRVAQISRSLQAARSIAKRLTQQYQAGMKPYGGSSGGYRVIEWVQTGRTISGYWLDRTPDAG
ncbi:MAG: hypothetical protein EBY66_00925 [Candidatus Fonsibacter lacus]|nr:hypothetical protein [Candidatus Fonsibacter lacus]